MTIISHASLVGKVQPSANSGVQWILGCACGLLIANVYYAQPLSGLISSSLRMPLASAGLLVTLPLAGYGFGLLAIVPLGDLVENRRLVLLLVAAEALCLAVASLLSSPILFLAFAFLIGSTAAAVQILVPYVTYLLPETESGQAVGRVVSGVMLGIMLARPTASLIADWLSWRAVFQISAVAMVALIAVLRVTLPERRPQGSLTYPDLIGSMHRIFASTEVLRRRGYYHALMFGAFSVFWTALPLWLAGPQFGLTQKGIAWVALAGVAGALAPPFAGRLADRGLSGRGTAAAMVMASAAFLLSYLARDGSRFAIGLVVAAAIVLDFAVSANLVFGQRAIYALGAERRSRINGLFMATFFVGGAIGSALSGWVYAQAGWTGVTLLGVAFPMMALGYFSTDRQP